jgi:TetR/AcrR family transcriptional regulator, transcriptional repressor for nem operon
MVPTTPTYAGGRAAEDPQRQAPRPLPTTADRQLQEAAVAYGQSLSAGRARSHGATKKGRQAYADRYLNVRHRDNPGDGCTMAALAPEVARATPELKAAFQRGLEEILSAGGGDRKEAIFQTAALLGGVALARAVKDERLSNEILDSVRQKIGLYRLSRQIAKEGVRSSI